MFFTVCVTHKRDELNNKKKLFIFLNKVNLLFLSTIKSILEKQLETYKKHNICLTGDLNINILETNKSSTDLLEVIAEKKKTKSAHHIERKTPEN